jgi:ribonuclease P protein component
MASGSACVPVPVGRFSPRGAAGAAPSCQPEALVLPAAHRMRRSREFSQAVQGGRRAARPSLVLHLAPGPAQEPTRVGLVVSKQVGNAVVRHRVARRLRGVLAERMRLWPSGRLVVVRALPRSATCSSAELALEIDRAWDRANAGEAR